MSTANPSNPAYPEFHPYGLPMGTVRGFLSILICSFFWIALLYPFENPQHVPLAHFFLLTLVFLAFASQPIHEAQTTAFLPWLMRVIFVGGSIAVVIIAASKDPHRMAERLTPSSAELAQWPVLLGCLAGGFGVALTVRTILGRNNELFQTIRAWMGVLAVLMLLFETLFQFVILPSMSDKPGVDTLKIWEGTLIAVVAAYFGSRA
jgi:hypothetical protein